MGLGFDEPAVKLARLGAGRKDALDAALAQQAADVVRLGVADRGIGRARYIAFRENEV